MQTTHIIITDNTFDADVKHFWAVGTECTIEPFMDELWIATKADGVSQQYIRLTDVVEVLA